MKKLPHIRDKFTDWYHEVINKAELVDQSPVRGMMVIRPYGNDIWENIKKILDARIKATGHKNAIFPLLIPESFFKREAEHVEGFAPELAVVTHAGGKKLEEPLIVRPTSEVIVHYMFARWIKSWRDLPLKINQWANVVRWEMRPRPFLRTIEFFWQEGHTAHETHAEAEKEARLMLDEYISIAHDYLAIPVISGVKSDSEKFPGAEKTFTFEAIMPDGKALQMGTSHLLSQSFAQSFEIMFQDRSGKLSYPFLTSWGTTTRLIGAIIMMHGDNKGLVLPPKISPIQVIIVPIIKKDSDINQILTIVKSLKEECVVRGIRAEVDTDLETTPGAKFYHWELKGVPIRIEIGPRDIEKNQVIIVDRLGIQKRIVHMDSVVKEVERLLLFLQKEIFRRAKEKQDSLWNIAKKLKIFGKKMEKEGGLYQTGWCGNISCEQKLKKYKATIRCLVKDKKVAVCFLCDEPSLSDVLVAKSY